MQRLALLFFAVLVVMAIAGTMAVAKSKSPATPRSQVVDNVAKGHFKADESRGKSSEGLQVRDQNYRFARPEKKETDLRLKIEPVTGDKDKSAPVGRPRVVANTPEGRVEADESRVQRSDGLQVPDQNYRLPRPQKEETDAGFEEAAAAEDDAGSAPTSYSQVVDNATKERFEADERWGTSSYGLHVHDENYRYARPAENGTEARFGVEIPETADYVVYARWPKVKGLNASVPVGVETTSGIEWRRVNQQRDGGRWVRIGVFEMPARDDYSIRFSPETNGKGYVAADAVKVVRAPADGASSKRLRESDDSTGSKGQEVVNEARRYMGFPYRLGKASRSGIDCSGLTMLVYRKFGISLPHHVERQSRYGSLVQGKPKAGDLVFFDEHGDGISHVGIATGRGTIIHASNYWRKVTETRIEYIKGYRGAKRLL